MIFRVIKNILKRDSCINKKDLIEEIRKRTGLDYMSIQEYILYLKLEGRISKFNGFYVVRPTSDEIKTKQSSQI